MVVSCKEQGCLSVANDHLNVADDQIEWVVDTGASYYATFSRETFTTYKAWNFGAVNIANSSNLKIIWIGDVYVQTNIGWTMTLKDMQHVFDVRLNLIFKSALDRAGYESHFENGRWKLIRGPLIIVYLVNNI